MAIEVRVPTLGESVTEGVIARWAKADGDPVAVDDVLLELETDKASMEIVAEQAGVLRIVRAEGETVEVGDVLARIEDGPAAARVAGAAPGGAAAEGDARDDAPATRESRPAAEGGAPSSPASSSPAAAERPRPAPVSAAPAHGEDAASAAPPTSPRGAPTGPLSPAVRHLIEEHELDPSEIRASGRGGRLTKADVVAHIERTRPTAATDEAPAAGASAQRRPAPSPPQTAAAGRPAAPPARETTDAGDGEEVVPLSRLRKRIAERLVEAQRTAAILTTFNEIDMSAVMALRAAHKERFRELHGVSLGFMSFFARACVAALQEIPSVNAEIRGESVVYRRFVHLGVAVGTARGLVVPVVRHAERRTFADLEREIGRLAGLARDNKLAIDDLAGGTFTISNGGVYGSLMSTPILNPPQSGILGMHKIEKRPVVVDDAVVIRPMMYVALSYDHRLVDGEQAVTFLVRVKERLEDPARLLLEV